MQTFVPYPTFIESAKVLDYRRLGKQRVETLQILNSLTGVGRAGWKNHPAVKMWAGHENGLCAYGVTICEIWQAMGYKDTVLDKLSVICAPDLSDLPEWWGDERIHSSHRANLLRKMPDHYEQYGWTEDPNMPYYWPTTEMEQK